jgi:hypothetical protein
MSTKGFKWGSEFPGEDASGVPTAPDVLRVSKAPDVSDKTEKLGDLTNNDSRRTYFPPERKGTPLVAAKSSAGRANETSSPSDREKHFDTDLSRLRDQVRDKGTDAISEYLAVRIEASALDEAFQGWRVSDQAGLGQDLESLDGFDKDIHEAVGESFKSLMYVLEIPDSDPVDLAGSIIKLVPIGFIDKTIGSIRLMIEVGGIAFSIMSGNPLLACACFKALVHDQVHDVLVSSIKGVLESCIGTSHAGNPEISDAINSSVPTASMPPSPNGPINPGHESGGRPPRPGRPRVPDEDTYYRPGSRARDQDEGRASYRSGGRPPRPGRPRVPDEDTDRRPGSRVPRSGMPPVPGGDANFKPLITVKRPTSGKGLGILGSKAATWRGGSKVQTGSIGQSTSTLDNKQLTFVRLRMYYAMQDQITSDDGFQTARLAQLIIVRDSRCFTLPSKI